MAQHDLLLFQNEASSGIAYTEKFINITKGSLLTSDTSGVPMVLTPGTDGYILTLDSTTTTGLKWAPSPSPYTPPVSGIWEWQTNKYAPYTTTMVGKFDNGTVAPTDATTRLNYNGVFYTSQFQTPYVGIADSCYLSIGAMFGSDYGLYDNSSDFAIAAYDASTNIFYYANGNLTCNYGSNIVFNVPLVNSSGIEVSLNGHTHSYQPVDADLTAIAALTGTSGLLKKTAADTWALDTSTYLTSITKAQVEAVLTGEITTHTHSYLPLAGGTMANTNVVSNLNADLLDGYHSSYFFQDYGYIANLNGDVSDGTFYYTPNSTNKPASDYGIIFSLGNREGWYNQIALGTDRVTLQWRSSINSTTSWNDWINIYNSANSNLSTVDWTTKNLYVFGTIYSAGNIYEGGTALSSKYEAVLGNPSATNYVLTSTTAGVRTWSPISALIGWYVETNNETPYNTLIGYTLGSYQSYSKNVVIGYLAESMGNNNVVMGYEAFYGGQGDGNVVLGYQAALNGFGNPYGLLNNKLVIANSATTTPLVYGDFSAASLKINGTLLTNNPCFKSGNGYCTTSEGIQIRWGTFYSTVDTAETTSFFRSFATACFSFTTDLPLGSPATVTASEFTVNRLDSVDGTGWWHYIAVGY